MSRPRFTALYPTDPPSLLVQRDRVEDARDVLFSIYGMKASASAGVGDREQAALALQLKELCMAVDEAKKVPRIKVVQVGCASGAGSASGALERRTRGQSRESRARGGALVGHKGQERGSHGRLPTKVGAQGLSFEGVPAWLLA